MTTTIAPADIRAFADAVRAQLDDLPTDDVDELLDGLEADLADQAAEAGDGFEWPDAAAYAAELRAAAGLPERDGEAAPRRTLRDRLDAIDATAALWVRSNPAIAAVANFFISLRPAWWLLRGAIAYLLIVGFLPMPYTGDVAILDRLLSPMLSPVLALTFAALVLVSVQWGRGRWVPMRWLRILRMIVSVVTALAAPVLIVTTVNDARNALLYVLSAGVENFVPGLAVDSQRVRNIFAYDADGNPIEHVQLFDQNGDPLTTVGPSGQQDEVDPYFYGGGGPVPVAEREIGRQPVWNVFPLRELSAEEAGSLYGDPLSTAIDDATAPTFPFAVVPRLPLATDDASPVAPSEASVPNPTITPAP